MTIAVSGLVVLSANNAAFAADGQFSHWAQDPKAKVIAGDYNGDGRQDIALVGGTGWASIPVALSNGDGTFTVINGPAVSFADWAQNPKAKVIAGDYNGDGRRDIALVGGVGWASIPVALSNGDGTFTVINGPAASFASWAAQDPCWPWLSCSAVKVTAGDYNGDGREDIALAGGVGWASIPVALSNGGGTFTVINGPAAGPAASLFTDWAQNSTTEVIAGDYSGDGREDIALVAGPPVAANVGYTAAWVPVAVSNGDGTFTVINGPAALPGGWRSDRTARVIAGDYNGDGRQDLALAGGAGWTKVPLALSNGNGTFTNNGGSVPSDSEALFASWAAHDPCLPLFASCYTVRIVAGDYNGDGRQDIALVGGMGWSSLPVAFPLSGISGFYLRNAQVSSFAAWAQNTTAKVIAGDYNGDGRQDIALVGGAGWSSLPVAFSSSYGIGNFNETNAPT